jgi:NADP-dependent 3-hydroxy acid dehydrogenase YdfG
MIVETDVNLDGKTALVTGASRGIGKCIAMALAERGAKVFLTARDVEKLSLAQKEIADNGGKAFYIPADLSMETEINSLFSEFSSMSKNLDILINNAGIGVFKGFDELDSKDFDRIFDINVKSMFLMCKKAMELMIPEKSGHIINISSVQGIKAYKKHSLYTASKHAVMGLTKALAVDTQEYNIRVSVILPGGVDTDLIGDARPDLDRSKLIRPEDIARTVLYFLSLSQEAMVDEVYIRRSGSTPF